MCCVSALRDPGCHTDFIQRWLNQAAIQDVVLGWAPAASQLLPPCVGDWMMRMRMMRISN